MSTYVRIASTEAPPEVEEKSHHLLPDISHIRIVSEQQCNVMKRNFEVLLQENNEDPRHPLNRRDFTTVFQAILPNSDPSEIGKLFDIIDGDNGKKDNSNSKMVSFHSLMNNPHNFNKLLQSMGCQLEENGDSDSYEDSADEEDLVSPSPEVVNAYVQTKTKSVRFRSPYEFKMGPLSEATELVPQLSHKQTYRVVPATDPASPDPLYRRESVKSNASYATTSSYATYKTMKNVNTNNYTEYISYQKEQIMELKSAIQESNRYEIRCNELQLILDTKHKVIHNLKEEIKHLNVDKNERMLQINNIREQYNELSQKFLDLNEYRKRHEMEQESNELMEQQVQHLRDERTIHRKKSEAMKTEKEKLNQLNEQFTHVNEQLRNELENERTKVEKLRDAIVSKDEEVRSLTLSLLSRDQTIQSLQHANEDLATQLNYQFGDVRPESMRLDTGNGEAMDWGYGQSFCTASPENLEFDLFVDLDLPVNTPRAQRSIVSTTSMYEPYMHNRAASRHMTPRHKMNPSYSNVYSPPGPDGGDIVIKLAGAKRRKKDSEDEKTYEANDWNTAQFVKRITELEQEVETYKYNLLHQATKTNRETQTKSMGFWESVFQNIGCVPNMFDNDVS